MLMQRYYRAVKSALQISTILQLNLEERLFSPEDAPTIPLGKCFQERQGLLDLRYPNAIVDHPEALLDGFLVVQQKMVCL